ncbi:MAG TPA: bestrophin family protein [Candidatus Obscuribacterales bacterium]
MEQPPELSNQMAAELAAVRASQAPETDHHVLLWTRPFTRLHRVPVFKRVWVYLAFVAAYTCLVDALPMTNLPVQIIKEAGAAGAYGGLVMGLLLVFRTNSAYERWWEGRKLWGQLTNESRNICLKVRALTSVSREDSARFGQLIISFAFALKHHLRGTTPSEPLPAVGEVTPTESKNLPLHISKLIYDTIGRWRQEERINEMTMLVLDQHARALMDICGACERIKSSPLAVSYRAFMRQGIALNLLAWPWYFTHEFALGWTLPPMLIGAYFLIGIELIAEDVEEPFGKDDDDLPLDEICNNIKNSVSSIAKVNNQLKFTTTIERPRVDLLKETGI